MNYILYNPNAGSCTARLEEAAAHLSGETTRVDITDISSYTTFLSSLTEDDTLMILGGDGTLNRFINETEGLTLPENLLYFPAGSGNDFAHEMDVTDRPISIREQIKDLPKVTVKGKTYRVLNGVGYGIDGYCCQVGDELRKDSSKKVDYTAIAIKGLLFHYKPTNATVTVDGVEKTYRKVWLAPTMNGKYYGGGMIPTPGQKRNSGVLSVMLFHGSGKLHTLMIFPSIFKGEHVKQKKHVEVLSGKEITVTFDRPSPLQIDGETILDVTSYTITV